MSASFFAEPQLPEGKKHADLEDYRKKVTDYSRRMLKVMEENELYGEIAWINFTAMFRKETLNNISTEESFAWCMALEKRGVMIFCKPRTSHVKLLIHCREADSFPGNSGTIETISKPGNYRNVPQTARKDVSPAVSALTQAYIGRQRFSGDYDFEPYRLMYDVLCEMFQLSEEEKVEAMPVMLEGTPLLVFGKRLQNKGKCYDEIRRFYYKTPLHYWKKSLDFILRAT